MPNELLFFLHIIVLLGITLGAALHSRGALLGFLGIQAVCANLFVAKQIALFGLAPTASEVFIVSGMYGVSIMQHLYGDRAAREAVWSCLGMLVLFMIIAWFHGSYQLLTSISTSDTAYQALLGNSPRLALASLSAYFLSERVNLSIMHLLTPITGSRIALHSGVIFGQAVDTVTFGLIGLYGVITGLGQVMLFCFGIKCVVIACTAPVMAFIRPLLKRA